MTCASSGLWILATCLSFSVTQTQNWEYLLKKRLMKEYDTSIRPIKNISQPLHVSMDITPKQIINLDERNQVLYTNVWFRISWRDDYLSWQPSEYGGLSLIHFPPKQIWLPDIILYNDASEENDRDEVMKLYRLEVAANGTIKWVSQAIVKSVCKVNVKNFPYDQQSCELKFGSWAYNAEEMDLMNSTLSADQSQYVSNGEWDLVDMPHKRTIKMYLCCPQPFVDLTYFVIMRRRPLYYVFNLMAPCVPLTAVALMGFVLPTDSGERISLVVTVLLAKIVFLLVIAEDMPPQSEVIPLMGEFFGLVILLLSISTILNVLVLCVHYRGCHGLKMPHWLRKVAFDVVARVLFVKRTVDEQRKVNRRKDRKKKPGLAFRTLEYQTSDTSGKTNSVRILESNSLGRTLPTDRRSLGEIDAYCHMNELQKLIFDLKEKTHRLQCTLEKHFEEGDLAKACQTEWRLIAMMLDRLFFGIFSTTSVVVFIAYMFPPMEYDRYYDL